ncbi:uncharacterized protein LOC132282458 [Cornus florida]|uniref:uncharacterized protein LOC132282458 n=1 Tax=Cornus florida TaxID=4283 RepID=UPI0028A0C9B6|nr:uncharacterized protein LOC132282458 [Cornus florida]
MKIVSLVNHGWTMVIGLLLLLLFCIGFTNSEYIDGEFESRNGHSVTYKYDRIDEVKKECASILRSASELKPDDNRVYSIKEELTFTNGDWWQELNGAPLMPFDDRNISNGSMDLRSPLKLVSFWVTDVDRAHRSKKSVSVSGAMQIGMTLDGIYMEKPYEGSPQFTIWPRHSQLSVFFQGISMELEENGGERVMCLLGTTMLPSRQPDSSDPWEWVKISGYENQPPLLQDDEILLVLHYPKKFNLTKRAIRGSMKSLNPKSNLKYFDEVHISSWMVSSAKYEFGSDQIVGKACHPYPYEDRLMSGNIDVYKGPQFCSILERVNSNGNGMTIMPNWRCNSTDDFCSKLGPFMSDKEINATDGGFKDVKLVLQDARCEEETLKNDGLVRVSAVFRVVPPNQFNAAVRTGLNNMTLSAEGIWKSSSGQLCMVGCPGLVDAKGNGCDSRICLYIPLSFSIKQRSIIMGTFSSINGSTRSYFPLSFEKLVELSELWDPDIAFHAHYKYSKLDSAAAVLEKNEPFNFGTIIKRSLLKFPKLEDTEAFLSSLSLLSEDLTLHVSAFPDPIPTYVSQRVDLQVEIVSVGPLFGHRWSSQNGSTTEEETPYHSKAEYTEKQLLLNVSAQLRLTGKPYNNVSMLFVEGLYDQRVGKMYLIGCRDVRASWKVLFESMDLEAGLDCLIEVVVSYPPTTTRWLINPRARISISSQRNEDDPLYFSPIKLQTLPIMYRRQREEILSRRGVEGILRIITLSVAIAFIWSQLIYIKETLDSVPYISLVMLGVQALGYSLPLITGAEALFKRMSSETYESSSYDLDNSQWIHVIDYTVKLLVLVAFSLTLRLCQKVWRSRIRLLTRSPLEPHRVPNDKWVLITALIIHVIGYVIVLIYHSVKTTQSPLQSEKVIDSSGIPSTLREWETELEEYVGLVQDFFLLPQIIGNLMWQIHCQPLRKLYFVGITVVRLLPHIYDCIRSPIPNPYFSQEYEFVNPRLDFYSKFGDIAIPVTAVLLAVVVYIQQKWNYEKLSQTLILGRCRLLPLGSRMYERLPSRSFEAELASGVNKNDTDEKEHDDEE